MAAAFESVTREVFGRVGGYGRERKGDISAGVENLKRIPTVIDAMRERGLDIHGVIYNIDKGLLEEVDEPEDEKYSVRRVKVFERR